MSAQDTEQPIDNHFDALMLQIRENLQPAPSLDQATLKLSTHEVYEKLQEFYPSATYDAPMVARALLELGYNYADPYKDLSFVWLFC
ncbi:hypothetical protein [Hymenobacter sp. BT190]|uniref:hypothetical protein n=1 Tax=Hymenobacter sp. BT190 TaxID=2763505 RepID=UPI0016511600|nr:hypothetical protein [Hymenobacter sp. BT190]MBC6698100.1 hypothetical protein [Hymenobacter sp. BT190]